MEGQVSTKSLGIKYGIILGLFSIGYNLILQVTGLITEQWLGWLSFIFMIVILVFAYKEFKVGNNGFMRLGQGIGLGMLIIFISTVLASIFNYIYLKFIDDSMISMILENTREEMAKNPDMSDTQIDQAMAMTEKFMNPEMLLGMGIISAVFVGFLISLVMSLIMKNEDPDTY